MTDLIPKDYTVLLNDIKQRVRSAQYEALKAVNRELISLYWDIGQIIVERQKNETWGKSVVEQLAKDLQAEFPGIHGFSKRNIWNMRNFFMNYSEAPKLQQLAAEIGWMHNIVIIEKCKDSLEREFYIRMTRKFGWSRNVLIHQLENQTYEKTLLRQTNFEKTLPQEICNQAKLAVKDDNTFDFLELGEEHSEHQLELAVISKIEKFLREMGGVFAFLGSQYRLEVSGEEYFIDLLLYHRALKCLVAIELKIGKFIPEFIGKMQFYLAVAGGCGMSQIRQTLSGKSKFVSVSKSNIQTLEKVQTTSAQTKKIFGDPNICAQKSEIASRKFNLLYYAPRLPLSLHHYPISQTVSAISEVRFKEPHMREDLKNNSPQRAQSLATIIFESIALFAMSFIKSFNELSSISVPSAFIGVHPRLIYRTAPAEGR